MLKVSGSYWQVHAGEYKQKGASKFEKELVRLDIRHILARANHPQTNGKLERFHGEIERYLHESKEESVHRTTGEPHDGHVGEPFHILPRMGAIDRFMDCHNHDLAHRSLGWERHETPAQAFSRKMPSAGESVIDWQTGEEYHAK